MRRSTAVIAASIAAVMLLAACSPTADDFREEAEKFIESRAFSEETELLRISDAECAEPASTDADTRYTCTGTDENGTRFRFTVEITGDSDLLVYDDPEMLSLGTGASLPETSAVESSGASSEPPPPTTTAGAPTTTGASAAATTGPTTGPTTSAGAATTSGGAATTTAG